MLAEVPQDIPLSHDKTMDTVSGSRQITGSGTVSRPDPPSVVTQHLQIERQFVIINSKVMNNFISIIIIMIVKNNSNDNSNNDLIYKASYGVQRNRDALHNIALYKFPILFYSILFYSIIPPR